MAKNYYQILDLQRNCSELDIIKAYKKLALRYHPNRTKDDKIAASYLFNQVTEAFEVLSDFQKRSCYDQYGEFGLKQGDMNGRGGYRSIKTAEEIFQNFFKSEESLERLFGVEEIEGSMFGTAMRGVNHIPAPKPNNLEVNVPCTLEELYNGCSKCISYKRIILNPDRITTSIQGLDKNIDIHKGYKIGQRIIFPSLGNMSADYPPSDLVFIIEEIPHSCFIRNGNDLKYTHKLRLLDCLLALPIGITTLDKRVITISFEEIITPKSVKVIYNEGMPIINEKNAEIGQELAKNTKGNLIVSFNIKFPKHIADEKKRKAIELLS